MTKHQIKLITKNINGREVIAPETEIPKGAKNVIYRISKMIVEYELEEEQMEEENKQKEEEQKEEEQKEGEEQTSE